MCYSSQERRKREKRGDQVRSNAATLTSLLELNARLCGSEGGDAYELRIPITFNAVIKR